MTRFTLWGLMEYDPTLFNNIMLPEELDKELLIDDIVERSGDLYTYYQVPSRCKYQIEKWFARNYDNFSRMVDVLLMDYDPIENYNRYTDETTTENRDIRSSASGSDNVQQSGSDGTNRNITSSNTLSGTDSLVSSGEDTNTEGGTQKSTLSGSDKTDIDGSASANYTENQVSAYDSSSYQPHEKTMTNTDTTSETTYGKISTDTFGKTNTMDYGKTETTNYGKVDSYTAGETDTTNYGRVDTTTYGRVDTVDNDDIIHHVDHTHGNIGVTTTQQMIQSELELRKFNIYDYISGLFEQDLLLQIY